MLHVLYDAFFKGVHLAFMRLHWQTNEHTSYYFVVLFKIYRAAKRGGSWTATHVNSVAARLGKGQGAKEIGHNLAREQPKFGHKLVRAHNRAQFRARMTKIRTQSSA